MVIKYTPVTCYIVFYFFVRLYIYRYFCRCLFDRSRDTKTSYKVLRDTSVKTVKQHCLRGNCSRNASQCSLGKCANSVNLSLSWATSSVTCMVKQTKTLRVFQNPSCSYSKHFNILKAILFGKPS